MDTKAIKQRCEAATPGPWVLTTKGNTVQSLSIEGVCHGMKPKNADADFIAHARIDLPELLTAYEQLSQENETLRNEICLKCGNYHEAHKGACNGCRWKALEGMK